MDRDELILLALTVPACVILHFMGLYWPAVLAGAAISKSAMNFYDQANHKATKGRWITVALFVIAAAIGHSRA